MPSCVACGAELEPPVRIPHTVYVRSLYRIAGQDYCRRRHHRGQGRRWNWHHCCQPHWVTEGTMPWGSSQGTAHREVSFPEEGV